MNSSSTWRFLRAAICSSSSFLSSPLDTASGTLNCTFGFFALTSPLSAFYLSSSRYSGSLIHRTAQNGAETTGKKCSRPLLSDTVPSSITAYFRNDFTVIFMFPSVYNFLDRSSRPRSTYVSDAQYDLITPFFSKF